MPHITRLITALASVAAIACSAAEGTETETTSNESAEALEGLVLNEVNVAGEIIKFVEYLEEGQSPLFIVENRASAYATESILDRLEAEVGPLTLLETFHALAPAAATPHADLVRFHEEQVAVLGRADASVQRVEFDVNKPVEKSASACDAWAAANAWPGQPWDNAANNQANMVNGGNVTRLCRAVNGLPGCDKLTTQAQLVGACNDGPGDIFAFPEWRRNTHGWRKDNFVVRFPQGTSYGWRFPSTDSLLKTQVLAINTQDEPDFITPAYYVRARATTF